MPCYDPSGPDIDLAYEQAKTQQLEKLLVTACNLLIQSGLQEAIIKTAPLYHWLTTYNHSLSVLAESERQKRIALEAREKPFKDLTPEEKKALKDCGYL